MPDVRYHFIKFASRDQISKTSVLLCMALETGKKKLERIDAVVSPSHETTAIDAGDTYRDCTNRIQNIILSGHSSQSSSISLINHIKNQFTQESFTFELNHYLEHGDGDKLKNLMERTIQRVFGSRSEQESALFLSENTQEEMDALSPPPSTDLPKAENDAREYEIPSVVPPGSKIVKFQFIVAPVTGTEVSELRLGDRILIKIQEGPDSNDILSELQLKDQSGIIIPCPGIIIDLVHNEDDSTSVVVKLGEGIYGQYIEAERNIRVKMAEPSQHDREVDQYQKALQGYERGWVKPAIFLVSVITVLWIIVAFFVT
ncbi:MAG TPA: hypothetical protein PL048_05835 [Leptospiraceae bacterium]|nr:hypothetical protein [Leptospiraceae bacterium]HMY65229.1 hypothetical protein [Leptospiraceae bacterium]HMZ58273.1 hypothetical protein [Leptospiraceae bacterium]HNF23010.1 hypothetical protein [Leptospiraceae bacterium]HNH07427.1 hypothetical protein [Leptospiraceae bacterium]